MATTKMPTMNWGHKPVADAFRAFKARTEMYLEDQNVNDRHKQATKMKIALGDEGMIRILASGLSDDDKKDPNAVWKRRMQ